MHNVWAMVLSVSLLFASISLSPVRQVEDWQLQDKHSLAVLNRLLRDHANAKEMLVCREPCHP